MTVSAILCVVDLYAEPISACDSLQRGPWQDAATGLSDDILVATHRSPGGQEPRPYPPSAPPDASSDRTTRLQPRSAVPPASPGRRGTACRSSQGPSGN